MSRRLGLALFLALLAVAVMAPPALAADPRPRILSAEWTSKPLTALTVETLEVRAVDLDGVVTTVNVFWGDGMFDHADLICFDAREVVEVRLTHVYREPGAYVARVFVGSGPRCATVDQVSRVEQVRTAVFPAPSDGPT
ncbi:MAG: hypothetical protein ABR518_06945 [Actinomycetota bacterium]